MIDKLTVGVVIGTIPREINDAKHETALCPSQVRKQCISRKQHCEPQGTQRQASQIPGSLTTVLRESERACISVLLNKNWHKDSELESIVWGER